MLDIMFMCQKRNEAATDLNRVTRTVYPLGSQFRLPRGTSSLERMCLLGHVITEQRCEIQSLEHKPNRRNTECNETVRRLFNLHIAIIYHGFTVVTLTAPCGIFTLSCITGVMVYN